MRLEQGQLNAVKEALNIEPIPEGSPDQQKLKEKLGEHTFFAIKEGLLAFEPADEQQQPPGAVVGVLLASWSGDNQGALALHPPKRTSFLVPMPA